MLFFGMDGLRIRNHVRATPPLRQWCVLHPFVRASRVARVRGMRRHERLHWLRDHPRATRPRKGSSFVRKVVRMTGETAFSSRRAPSWRSCPADKDAVTDADMGTDTDVGMPRPRCLIRCSAVNPSQELYHTYHSVA